MNELQQEQKQHGSVTNARRKLLAVRAGPREIRYLTPEELEQSITQEEIQRGLDLAGSWQDLGLNEEELFAALNRNRGDTEPAPLIGPA